MKRKNKIILGVIAILLVLLSALIGLWLLSDVGEAYAFGTQFVFRFFLIITPAFVILTIINLLKKDK